MTTINMLATASVAAPTLSTLSHIPQNATILTGDRPTGALHLGHYVGSLQTRLALQDRHNLYVLIADTQTMNNDIMKAKEARNFVVEIMKDYLSCGLDPDKVCFFLQSDIHGLFELTNYLSNLMTLPQVMRIPTIKAENAAYNSIMSMGFLNYPVSQAADILLFEGEYVPVGIDQVAIIEFANDVREKFHHAFNTDIFKHIQPLLSQTPKLTGTKGPEKMSKSLNNAIFLSDSTQSLKAKINSLYTDSNHLRVCDPGQVEGNKVFEYLDVFHKNTQELQELKKHYQKGGLGDSVLKKLLYQDLEELLGPIRDKRNALSQDYVLDVLKQGTQKAKQQAQLKMSQIKNIIFN